MSALDQTTELRALLATFVSEVLCYDSDETLRLLKREDLSMPRIAALHVLQRLGAASISEIGYYLGLSLSNTSILVDKLVCAGFVTREEDTSDRRQKLVRLTPRGQALVEEVRAARVHGAVQRMRHLPPELLERTSEVLREIVARLAQSETEQG